MPVVYACGYHDSYAPRLLNCSVPLALPTGRLDEISSAAALVAGRNQKQPREPRSLISLYLPRPATPIPLLRRGPGPRAAALASPADLCPGNLNLLRYVL